MRVTAQTKAATRETILRVARRLFAEKGYEATRTREVALAAGIATGTLFNYFKTKDDIVAGLASSAVSETLAAADGNADKAETLEEDLFAFVARVLRKLKPLRKHLPALLETSLSPLANVQAESDSLRVDHLETVARFAARHGFGELPPTALQLYWTLYTGLLVFWANDESPKQEDTLALIDDSVNMFVGWLRVQASTPSESRKRGRD